MIDDGFQWVLTRELIPKKNLEWWYENSEEWKLTRSQIWHYGWPDKSIDHGV